MKIYKLKYLQLFTHLILFSFSIDSYSQNSKVFGETYFINSISDLLTNNIDSVNIYSKNALIQDSLHLIMWYSIEQNEDQTVITRKYNTMMLDGELTISTQTFYLNKDLIIDTVLFQGVQDGVYSSATIDRKIIDYTNGNIQSVTLLKNDFSDTTITNYWYLGDLATKTTIVNHGIRYRKNVTTQRDYYIEYYSAGQIYK